MELNGEATDQHIWLWTTYVIRAPIYHWTREEECHQQMALGQPHCHLKNKNKVEPFSICFSYKQKLSQNGPVTRILVLEPQHSDDKIKYSSHVLECEKNDSSM